MRRLCIAMLLHASIAAAQSADLGHRLPGGVGLDAGSQPEPGMYFLDRFVWFASDRVNDREGNALPIVNFDGDAVANAVGMSGTTLIGDVYLTVAFAIPLVKLSVSADQPEASVDRFGLGSVYIA